MKRTIITAFLGAALMLAGAAPAAAAIVATMGFTGVSNNKVVDTAAGVAQLTVDLESIDNNASQVRFTFRNKGPKEMSITDIYWDQLYMRLAGIASFTDSGAGVDFGVDASPANLPGGNSINFTADISADSNNPTQPMGVNPGEFVSVLMNLNVGHSLNSIVSDLNTGKLRIGIHVQGYVGGGSESFVNVKPIVGPIPAPEPGAIGLFGLGVLALGLRRRKGA